MWTENQSGERVIMRMDEMVFKVRYSMWNEQDIVRGMKKWRV